MIDVSIIVPAYNAEKYIVRCVDSICKQTFKNIEIICVDDGSSDDTYKILLKLQGQDERIRIFRNEENRGTAYSRNFGIDVSRGRYLWFVDSDDYIENGAIAALHNKAEQYKSEMCFFKLNVHRASNYGEYLPAEGITTVYQDVYSGYEILEKFIYNGDFFMYPVLIFYASSFLKEHGIRYRNLKIGEGGCFILEALSKAKKVIIHEGAFYNYCIRNNSVMASIDKNKLLLLGQMEQYIVMLKTMTKSGDIPGIKAFLDYQRSLMAGEISRLPKDDVDAVLNQIPSLFSQHIFESIRRIRGSYDICMSDMDVKKIKKYQKVYLYGCSNYAYDFLEFLDKYQIQLMGIVVSHRENNPIVFWGHPVYAISEVFLGMRETVTIILTDSRYHKDIVNTLEKYGIKEYIIPDIRVK